MGSPGRGPTRVCCEVVLGAKVVKAGHSVHSNAGGEHDHAGQNLDIQLHSEEWGILQYGIIVNTGFRVCTC